MRCIPPCIQQMPAHHAHHHDQPIYNIDPDMGALIPPLPPQPPGGPPPRLQGGAPHDRAPAAREPRAEPARMAAAPAARGSSVEPAWMAQEPRAEPATRGAVGAPRPAEARKDWVRDWSAISDPLGGKALPLVLEVYGLLSWATSGTTRGSRDGPFDAVLFWRSEENQKYPRGGWVAQEDHEGVLRTVICAGWPNQEAGWPVLLEGGAEVCVTDAEANVWLPRALRAAPCHWCYRQRCQLPLQPQPPHKRRRR